MKKLFLILFFFPFIIHSQTSGGIKVTQLPTTTTGSSNDFLIKDDAAGTPGL